MKYHRTMARDSASPGIRYHAKHDIYLVRGQFCPMCKAERAAKKRPVNAALEVAGNRPPQAWVPKTTDIVNQLSLPKDPAPPPPRAVKAPTLPVLPRAPLPALPDPLPTRADSVIGRAPESPALTVLLRGPPPASPTPPATGGPPAITVLPGDHK